MEVVGIIAVVLLIVLLFWRVVENYYYFPCDEWVEKHEDRVRERARKAEIRKKRRRAWRRNHGRR